MLSKLNLNIFHLALRGLLLSLLLLSFRPLNRVSRVSLIIPSINHLGIFHICVIRRINKVLTVLFDILLGDVFDVGLGESRSSRRKLFLCVELTLYMKDDLDDLIIKIIKTYLLELYLRAHLHSRCPHRPHPQ